MPSIVLGAGTSIVNEMDMGCVLMKDTDGWS